MIKLSRDSILALTLLNRDDGSLLPEVSVHHIIIVSLPTELRYKCVNPFSDRSP